MDATFAIQNIDVFEEFANFRFGCRPWQATDPNQIGAIVINVVIILITSTQGGDVIIWIIPEFLI